MTQPSGTRPCSHLSRATARLDRLSSRMQQADQVCDEQLELRRGRLVSGSRPPVGVDDVVRPLAVEQRGPIAGPVDLGDPVLDGLSVAVRVPPRLRGARIPSGGRCATATPGRAARPRARAGGPSRSPGPRPPTGPGRGWCSDGPRGRCPGRTWPPAPRRAPAVRPRAGRSRRRRGHPDGHPVAPRRARLPWATGRCWRCRRRGRERRQCTGRNRTAEGSGAVSVISGTSPYARGPGSDVRTRDDRRKL